jgi:anti-anti-sigma factor
MGIGADGFELGRPLYIDIARGEEDRMCSDEPTDRPPRVITAELFDEQGAAIVVDGDLDLETAPQLASAIADMIAEGHLHLVIDLSAATFLDSMAMGTLLRAVAPLRADPAAAVALAGAHGIVDRSLSISGIGEMFARFDSREAAIDAMGDTTAPMRDTWRTTRSHPYP